eukprot:TRINITY_DN68043_c0_g2_i1.p4 TRINITY_DN68043_c0_g2~~TRINITY_DN68043_c0_g2_i1.p4  ORF type:complete len:119 (-),score=12.52 TRINITY_DN68043_c0_g2_i1:123-479(-)
MAWLALLQDAKSGLAQRQRMLNDIASVDHLVHVAAEEVSLGRFGLPWLALLQDGRTEEADCMFRTLTWLDHQLWRSGMTGDDIKERLRSKGESNWDAVNFFVRDWWRQTVRDHPELCQ